MRVQHLVELVASQRHLRGVDDDDMIAGIGMRRVRRLVLAAQQESNLRRETAEHHVCGVDDVPLMSQIIWLRCESLHDCTFSHIVFQT